MHSNGTLNQFFLHDLYYFSSVEMLRWMNPYFAWAYCPNGLQSIAINSFLFDLFFD